jgi:multidrug resistance efflux pump
MTNPQPAADRVIPLRLPDLGDEGQPGGRFVKRAVSVTLLVVAALAAVAVVVSLLVRMDVTVKTAGVLEPVRVWPVRAQLSGAVREVGVESGDTVAAGDVVLQLDVLALETQLAQLEAQYRGAQIERSRSAASAPIERRQQSQRLDAAQARLTSARALLLQRMVEHGFGTSVDSLLGAYRTGQHVALDQAVGQVRGAEADIRLNGTETDLLGLRSYEQQKSGAEMDRLAAQIRDTRERISRGTVRAPTAGVVLTDEVERLRGAFVQEGQPLLEVGELGEWRVTMLVPERDVNKIAVGDAVRVEVQAFSQRERHQLDARVSFVASEPVGAGEGGNGAAGASRPAASSGPGVYRVVATLAPGQAGRAALDKFRRGYSVQANVVTRSGRIAELGWGYLRDRLDGK